MENLKNREQYEEILPFVFRFLDSFLVINDDHGKFLLEFAHLVQCATTHFRECLVQFSVYPIVQRNLRRTMVGFCLKMIRLTYYMLLHRQFCFTKRECLKEISPNSHQFEAIFSFKEQLMRKNTHVCTRNKCRL